ncbi:MAG: hypothetical protein JSV86_18425 [Gemmatimonadota bacterium]|nr:MAG: hypothetical protein JSV86_18425 [Gemmatimonadota bacterium]
MNHCEESAEVPHDNSTMPCVTASGPLKKQDGTIIWAPEDFTYCACEWNAGRGVYLAPVRFGHVGRVVLYPDDEVELDF